MMQALVTAYLTGVGQSYMGGSVGVATETIGTLAKIGRCMLLPPRALACGASAGGYGVNAKMAVHNPPYGLIIPEKRRFVGKFSVKDWQI
jgi:hypothetical protein